MHVDVHRHREVGRGCQYASHACVKESSWRIFAKQAITTAVHLGSVIKCTSAFTHLLQASLCDDDRHVREFFRDNFFLATFSG